MKAVVMGVLLWLLVGCQLTPNDHGLPLPPVPTTVPVLSHPGELFQYTTEMNWYLLQLYDYVESVNRYSAALGWQPPSVKPLCRFTTTMTLDPFPPLSLSGVRDHDVPVAMANHLRRVRELYELQQTRLSRNERMRREACLY